MDHAHPRVRLAYRVPEVAEALGISRQTVYRLMADGDLAFFEIRERDRRVPASELERFIAAKLERRASRPGAA